MLGVEVQEEKLLHERNYACVRGKMADEGVIHATQYTSDADCGSTQSGNETPDPTAALSSKREERNGVVSVVEVVVPTRGLKRSATVCMDLHGVDTLLTKTLLESKAKRRKPLAVKLAPATFSFQGPRMDRRANSV
jgi:hypothetical protein